MTATLPIRLYVDAECTEPHLEGAYPFAELREGERNVITLYLRNESRYDILDLAMSDTDPRVITRISPTRLGPGEVAEVEFNLSAEITVGMDLTTLNGKMRFTGKVQPRIIPRRVPFDEEKE